MMLAKDIEMNGLTNIEEHYLNKYSDYRYYARDPKQTSLGFAKNCEMLSLVKPIQ